MEKRAETMLQLANEDDYDLTSEEKIKRGYFKTRVRMPCELFELLFQKVEPMITKQVTKFRKPISALDR
jgi:hypothetical protein